jgi:GH15 family glucan-1,4-alpha-glucosidase
LLAPVDSHPISSYATGIKGFNGREGTWRDAEDGELLRSAIDQGSVDSTIAFHLTLGPNESDTVDLALCCGASRGKVLGQLDSVRKNGFMRLLDGTRQYWRLWCRRPDPVDHILGKKIGDFYRRSLLIMRTQIDNQGAILAANDTDIMSFHRAHYSYMWPRDGALVCATLDRAGYGDITRQFFRFCHRVLPPDKPAFYHKYAADGSVGSSWHPWLQDGLPERPIQEDETALVIWALWEHYKERLDVEFIESLYAKMIVPCTSFLAAFRDPVMGLPQPSWDLWEERYGIHLFTCATVYAALLAGANFARMFGDAEQHFFKQAADELRAATLRHFWDADRGYFARMLTPKGGKLIADPTLDASCYAIFAFGMLPPEDARVVSTMAHLERDLWVKTDLGGVARYQKDYYFRQSDDYERIPGNPWIICTLFLAQYKIAAATTLAELKRTTLPFLEWVMARANSGGLLPEQVHPENGAHLSVAPLTWSHAEFVNTCQKYCAKVAELKAGTLDVSRPAS